MSGGVPVWFKIYAIGLWVLALSVLAFAAVLFSAVGHIPELIEALHGLETALQEVSD